MLGDLLPHYVVPALFVVYWLVYSRTGSLRWVHPFFCYPAAYFIYVLARGDLSGIYSYGFMDVSAIGYRHTIVNSLGLLIGFIVLGSLSVGLDRFGRRAAF